MPIKATASDRCSGSVQGSKVAPSAVGASAALRPKIFSTPTVLRVSISGLRSVGIHFAQNWTYPACRARVPVETGSSGSFASQPALSLRLTSCSSSIGSGAPVALWSASSIVMSLTIAEEP